MAAAAPARSAPAGAASRRYRSFQDHRTRMDARRPRAKCEPRSERLLSWPATRSATLFGAAPISVRCSRAGGLACRRRQSPSIFIRPSSSPLLPSLSPSPSLLQKLGTFWNVGAETELTWPSFFPPPEYTKPKTVAVVVSFFICWLPFHSQRLLATYLNKFDGSDKFLLEVYNYLTYISGVMYYLSSTINPLLYQLMSAKFRLAFKETFKCSLFKCAMFRRRPSSELATTTAALTAVASSARLQHQQPGGSPSSNENDDLASANLVSCCQCHALASGATSATPMQSSQLRRPQKKPMPVSKSQQFEDSTQTGVETFQSPLPGGLLARARGRLNSSLGSLLNIGNSHNGRLGVSPVRCCANCPRRLAKNGLNKRLRRHLRRGFSTLSEQRHEAPKSTPLLCPVHKTSTEGSDNFSRVAQPHTMLKFVHQSTVPEIGLACLSRLSSRDGDEENQGEHGTISALTMDALIRPKRDEGNENGEVEEQEDEPEEDYEDDELVVTTTSGGDAAQSSSQSSSPDQLRFHSGRAKGAESQVAHERRRRLSLMQQSNDSTSSRSSACKRMPKLMRNRRGAESRHLHGQQKQLCESSSIRAQVADEYANGAQLADSPLLGANCTEQAVSVNTKQPASKLSSSLSLSEKYLTTADGKKLSFSTTTSGAVEDCASLTSAMTNSRQHLNMRGESQVAISNATLGKLVSNKDSQEIENDPSTVINANQSTSDLDGDESDEREAEQDEVDCLLQHRSAEPLCNQALRSKQLVPNEDK